ncbi:MAG: hypothetical protein H7331_02410 [Bacteroidia bacterium]|nr:hypothetical protein [Bacteroidia bacterium]
MVINIKTARGAFHESFVIKASIPRSRKRWVNVQATASVPLVVKYQIKNSTYIE